MPAADDIAKTSDALLAAHRRAARALREAHIATKAAQHGIHHPVGPAIFRRLVSHAAIAQTLAIAEAARVDRIRSKLSAAWGSTTGGTIQ